MIVNLHPYIKVTIYAAYGLMSSEGKSAAESGARTVRLRAPQTDLNVALGNIFYYNAVRWCRLTSG